MLTLSYGIKKPESGDKGSVFFPALEDNMQSLNDHTHNGTNSAKLTTASITALTSDVLAASWVDQGGGTYRQTISMPSGLSYDTTVIGYKEVTTGETAYLKTEKVTVNSYYVYTNDSTKTFKAVYSS